MTNIEANDHSVQRSIIRAVPKEVYLIVVPLLTAVGIWVECDTIWNSLVKLEHKIGPVIFAYGLLLFGVTILIALWLHGQWVGSRAYGHRRVYHRYRRYVAESLDALEYLSRAKSNVSGKTLQAIKDETKTPAGSPEDKKTIAELLVFYKNIFQYSKGNLASLDDESKGNLIIIHNYLSSKVGEHPTDVTIGTAHEALSEPIVRHGVSKYVVGAVYFLLSAVALHSYVTILQNSSESLNSYYNKFDSVHHHYYSKDVPSANSTSSSNRADAMIALYRSALDTVNPIRNRDSAARRIYAMTTGYWKNRSSFDSVKLLAMELQHKLNHLHTRLKAYPIFIDMSPSEFPRAEQGPWQTNASMGSDTTKLYFDKLLAAGVYCRDAADHISHNIETFILPMLYGLLGAYLFVIRRMSKDIQRLDFTWKKSMRNSTRLILGLFVGVFFGYLFKTDSVVTLGAGITPFVLSFVFGYQVEVLFSAMDSVVKKFVGDSGHPSTPSSSPTPPEDTHTKASVVHVPVQAGTIPITLTAGPIAAGGEVKQG